MTSNNIYFAHFSCYIPLIYNCEFIWNTTNIKEYHSQLILSAKQFSDLMYESYSEWYNVADYSPLYDDLDEKELSLSNHYKKIGNDDFQIMWEIIVNRMEQTNSLIKNGKGNLKDIAWWVDLYNSYNEIALCDINEEPLLYINVGDIKTFPPYFIDYLLNNIEKQYCKHYFLLLKPFTNRLKGIQDLINCDDWPKNDIHKGFFIEWTIIFQELINQEEDN